MLAYCDFYHPRKVWLLEQTGDDYVGAPIIHKICPKCHFRLEKEVDEYVKQLAHRNDPAPPVSAVSCR